MILNDMKGRIGQELGLSRWYLLDQARIDRFADVTEDWQDIHVDPAAAAQTAFGGTIAHGFLSLSMISVMLYDVWAALAISDLGTGVNYGCDRLRFLNPVPSGTRVRGRFVLADMVEKRPGQFLIHSDITVESEGSARPVLVARWLSLIHRKD